MIKKLNRLIKSREANIAVIGLGYVGLPLSLAFLNSKFKVFGIDSNSRRVQMLKKGLSYISTIKSKEIKKFVNKKFIPTNRFRNILNSDIIIICVPTPISKQKKPIMKYVTNVIKRVEKYLKNNQIIILECTTYPGTTEEYFLPIFNKLKFKVGKNIFLGYSPEREDPGNYKYSITKKNLTKIVSGYTKSCKELTSNVYSTITNVYSVKNIKTAEFTKLLENTFRSVNIGLVNELFAFCDKFNINIFDAVKAANTKPFGYMPFVPGPGVGGHCIPVDPFYLTYKANQLGLKTEFIKLAGKINDSRPLQISKKIESFLKKNKSLKNKRILILGFSYKKDSDDTRESPVKKICEQLKSKVKNKLIICDPHIENKDSDINKMYKFINLKKLYNRKFLKSLALCFIGTNHSIFKYEYLSKHINTIFDSRNSFKKENSKIKLV